LLPILGMLSGYNAEFSKSGACQKVGMPWIPPQQASSMDTEIFGPNNALQLIPKCATYSYLHLQLESTVDAGDHVMVLCQLVDTGVWDKQSNTVQPSRLCDDRTNNGPMDHTNVLYTGLLRQKGIL